MLVSWLLSTLPVIHSLHIPYVNRNKPRSAQPQDATFTYEPISTGYVAFGDSYAAGIGAGVTSGDACRVGAFSYPNLLNTCVGSIQPGIDSQNLPCSGAKIPEVMQGASNSQIDSWTNPGNAQRATISIGGNDVGFYDVLTSCVLRVGQFFPGDCDKYINKAYSIMYSDTFKTNVGNTLRQIITKSGQDDFGIVQTGYPTFFNDQTDSCDCE
jgi:hypothetical protein